MTKSSNTCQSFIITGKAFKFSGIIPRFYLDFRKVIYNWVGMPYLREGHVENWD